ncbi:MAG TPA: AAA family ATPase [Bacteriovoracaceae bacterium]|nr:AAA family ATPase [Bacteriovoracaceae bacterium]
MHKTSEWLQSFSSPETKKQSRTLDFRPCVKISVTGGKGGVGKTSIALKTACELARAGHRTLLIDCDSNLSNTAIKLGLPIDNKFEKLLSSAITFEECLIQRGNLHLLPACNGSLELFESKLRLDEIITDIITSHEHEYDFIVLDCPAGLNRDALALNAFCDHRIVVVTPDKSSITDSYSLIKLLYQRFGTSENHILVNMHQGEKQFLRVANTLSETIQNFIGIRTHILGGIRKFDVPAEGFDTFFLSEEKSEWNKNFVKLLYGFTEKAGGPLTATVNVGIRQSALEQDVH